MAEYLQPQNNKLTITQKREMFGVKIRMVNIPYNFPKGENQTLCVCHEKEDMLHIYNCEILSQGKQKQLPYETIFNGTMNQQIEIFKIFRQNMDEREKIKNENCKPPCDSFESAISSVMY